MAYKPDYYPGRRGKRRFNFSRLFVTVVGLALIWHFTLYLGMRERYRGMRINPISNVIRVPYGMQADNDPLRPADKAPMGRVDREVLEAEIQSYARDMMDVYVYLVPWTVEFDPPETESQPTR
jgi:hypothetical protein